MRSQQQHARTKLKQKQARDLHENNHDRRHEYDDACKPVDNMQPARKVDAQSESAFSARVLQRM